MAKVDVPLEMMGMARREIMKAVSFGTGAYVSLLASVYLGFLSLRNFLAARATA